ncbi:MAG TPA: FAD-dependent oxidoreductase, partial [Myxococcota bacterium]
VELVDEVPGLPRLGRALRFGQQAEFEPLTYLGALADACLARGARIHTGVHVDDVTGGAQPHVVTSDGHTITARRAAIVCTNTPVNNRVAVHTKQLPYRSYAIALRVAAGTLPSALWWDTAEPYHYVRLVKADDRSGDGSDLLIVGGEDHKVSSVDDGPARFDRLEAWAKARFPGCGARTAAWSGQVMEPIDGLAFIGKNPLDDDNVYIATGDSGHGLTHGTIAAMMFSEMLFADEGDEHPWAKLYDPRRHSPSAVGEYAKETLNAVAQFGRWLQGSDVADVADIPLGSGAIQRRGLSLVAVYVDEDGHRRECSAVCPHLGAIVAWNDLEKSWDCPLHGSRFTTFGTVVNGPAISNLPRVDAAAPTPGPVPDDAVIERSGPVASWADRK